MLVPPVWLEGGSRLGQAPFTLGESYSCPGLWEWVGVSQPL